MRLRGNDIWGRILIDSGRLVFLTGCDILLPCSAGRVRKAVLLQRRIFWWSVAQPRSLWQLDLWRLDNREVSLRGVEGGPCESGEAVGRIRLFRMRFAGPTSGAGNDRVE